MRAAVYTRVSQDRTAAGRSVNEQETECRAVAERNGWTVTEVFTDNDRSASRYSKKDRPAFDQLRAHIEAGKCDVLITWEASRSTRDLATYVQLRDLCRGRGVTWNYSGRTYDLADASDQFGTGLDALLSEQESARSRNRVLRSVRANAAAGRPHGRKLYGYRRVYDVATKALLSVEIHDEHGPVVREIAHRIAQGEAFYSIGRDLEHRGVPAPSGAVKWHTASMNAMMRNENYRGQRVHQGQVVGDAMWPAIIDEDTWWKLQSILGDPARRTYRDTTVLKYLLTGIATCGLCGALMKRATPRGAAMYTCGAKFHVVRKQEWVDEHVTEILLIGLGSRDQRIGTGGAPSAGRDAYEAAAAKRARLDGFYDAAAAGELTPAALARIEQKLLAEIASHEADARRASLPHTLAHLAGTDIPAEWPTLSMATKRAIIRHYLTITVLPTVKGTRTFHPDKVAIAWK